MATAVSFRVDTVDSFILSLADEARDTGLSAEEVDLCVRATRKRFSGRLGVPLDTRMERRLRAYFDAVIRGYAMRSRGARMAQVRHTLVLASLAEDLAAADVSHERIVRELCEVYPAVVSLETIERITQRVIERVAS